MIDIKYVPWKLRGYFGVVYQVFVDITDSHSIAELIVVKHKLNDPPVRGLHLIDNKSKAIQRLGWRKIDDGLYCKYFG